MIVTRGFSRDTTDDENGCISLYGMGVQSFAMLLKINMDANMQNMDGGMRG